MRRIGIAFIVLLIFGVSCRAQQTTVTATVTDPNSTPYAFSTGYAALVCPGNQAPTYNGYSMPRTFSIVGFDGTGTFTQVVYDVNLIAPSGCGYQWHITYKDGITNFITGTITSVTGASVNESAAISAFAVLLPVIPSGTPPGGSSGQLQGNNSGTFGGVPGTSANFITGAMSIVATANNVTPLSVGSFSSSQLVPVVDLHNAGSGSITAPFGVRGFGSGSFAGSNALFEFQTDSDAASGLAWVAVNRQNAATLEAQVSNAGIGGLCGGNAGGDGNYGCIYFDLGTNGGSTAEIGSSPANLTGVPFTIAQLTVGETADLLDIKNSTGLVSHFDKSGNLTSPSITSTASVSVGTDTVYSETTAPSAGAGTDVVYGDSTAHCIKASLNNGSFICLAQVTAVPLTVGSGTGNVFVAPNGYFICTASCTVTPPLPTAGVKFCIQNDVNTTGVITLGALGGSGAYGNQANTAYGTAGTGTLSSGGTATDSLCIEGRDTTKYVITYHVGTWTAS